MKKHLFLILFVLIITGCFSACGKGNSNKESQGQNSESHSSQFQEEYSNLDQELVEEQSVTKVHITINPELELILGPGNRIISVICLNQDAKELFAAISILDQTYEDGFKAILEKSIELKYIEKDSKIKVEVSGAKETLDQVSKDQIVSISQNIINETNQSSGIIFGVEMKVENQEVDLQPTYPIVDKEFDSNGNLIREKVTHEDQSVTIKCLNAEGFEIFFERYHPDGSLDFRNTRVYQSTSPMVYTETNHLGESMDVTCDANGFIIFTSKYSASGDLFEEWWDQNQIIRIRITFTFGTVVDEEYKNGLKVKETTTHDTGVVEELYLEENVPVRKECHDPANGDRWVIEYVDGHMSIENGVSTNGTTWTVEYVNDVKVRSYRQSPDGSYEEQRFHENGLLIYVDYYFAPFNDSYISEYTVGANGKYTYYKNVSGDGYIYEVFYNADGVNETWRGTHPDGTVEHGIFDSEGRPIIQ